MQAHTNALHTYLYTHLNLISSPSPGKVFLSSAPRKLSLPEAAAHCVSNGSLLATVGQLHLAWRSGLQSCEPGLLSDGTIRYTVNESHSACGEGKAPGVYTTAPNTTAMGQPNSTTPFHLYCYRGQHSSFSFSQDTFWYFENVILLKLFSCLGFAFVYIFPSHTNVKLIV